MEKDEVLEHDYDGIQEYDNDLPRWWVWMFWGWIVFGVVYVGYYHFGPGIFPRQQVAIEMEAAEQQRQALSATESSIESQLDNAFFLSKAKDTEVLNQGKEIFVAKCMACHGMNAEGIVGPNLTDEYWIHGGEPVDIYEIILKGVIEKGMLAWENQLKKDELVAVTAYVISVEGTNPANAKAPEGEKLS